MSERSHQSLSHSEFSPDCTVLIVTGRVGPLLRRVKPVKQRLTHPLLFPQEFRLIERDRMGTSGCLCLNHREHLPSRSPGSPGILPHRVLQSFDLPRFEVLPYAPRIPILDDIRSGSSITAMYTVKSMPYCRLQPGTELSPSHPV